MEYPQYGTEVDPFDDVPALEEDRGDHAFHYVLVTGAFFFRSEHPLSEGRSILYMYTVVNDSQCRAQCRLPWYVAE